LECHGPPKSETLWMASVVGYDSNKAEIGNQGNRFRMYIMCANLFYEVNTKLKNIVMRPIFLLKSTYSEWVRYKMVSIEIRDITYWTHENKYS